MAKPETSEHPAYAAMLAESKRVGWPERFETDLTKWDREALSGVTGVLASTPIFWVLRRDGTYIAEIGMAPIDGAGHRVWDSPQWFPRIFGARGSRETPGDFRYYTWDGRDLRFHDLDPQGMADVLREMAEERAARDREAAEAES